MRIQKSLVHDEKRVELSALSDLNYSYEEVYTSLRETSKPQVDFYVLIFLSTVIATFGLLMGNTAVIIGAMLVSPLMEPILGIAFSSLTRNGPFVWLSVLTVISGILFAVLLSYVLTLPFISLGLSVEILSRIKPSLLDMFIALATGFIAGYAKVRKSIGGAIYGVAISISLIPPLCVIGIGIAHGRLDIFAGSALLFLTNLVSIIFSGILAFLFLEIDYFRKSLKSLLFPGLSVLILAAPLTFGLYALQQQKRLETELEDILRAKTYTFRRIDIISIHSDVFHEPATMEVVVRGKEGDITEKQVALVETLLRKKVGIPVELTVDLSPIVQLKSQASNSQQKNPKLD